MKLAPFFFSANKYDVQYVGGVGLCMKTLTRLCYKNVFLSVPAEWIGQVPTTFLCVIFSERLRVNVEVFQWKFCFDQSESCQSGQFCQFRLICMHCRVWLGGGGWFTRWPLRDMKGRRGTKRSPRVSWFSFLPSHWWAYLVQTLSIWSEPDLGVFWVL